MPEKRTRALPSLKLVLTAATAGIIAGAAAVYMNAVGSGNGTQAEVAQIDCSAATAKAATLKPYAKGEVAAMAMTDQSAPLSVGSFTGPNGAPITMDNIGGRVRLVNLWATWCVPCREEMPALDALQSSFKDRNFEVVAISIDTGSDEKPKAFLTEIGVNDLAFYHDPTMGTFNAMKKQGLAFGLPVTVLVDENGCMLGSMNGPAKWDSPDAKALIEAAL